MAATSPFGAIPAIGPCVSDLSILRPNLISAISSKVNFLVFINFEISVASDIADVASEADAAAHDDLAIRAVAREPFTGVGDDAGEFHLDEFRLDLADLVAKVGSFFEFLGLDGLGELVLKRFDFLVALAGHVEFRGGLAGVGRAFMHVFQHRRDAVVEDRVAIAATEAAGFFEVRLGETTDGAFHGGGIFFNLLRIADAEEQVRQRKTGRVVHALLFGAGFAEVHFLHFPVHDLGQKNRQIGRAHV